MTGTVCFVKKLLFVMQNLGIWGIMGTGGQNMWSRSAIFGIADPELPIHYATFMGLQWWLRVVYCWVPPLLSIFGRRWSGSRRPLLPAAGSQYTAVELPIAYIHRVLIMCLLQSVVLVMTVLSSRPYGRHIILWHKTPSPTATSIITNNRHLCVMLFSRVLNAISFLYMCIYMPYEHTV